MLDFFLKVILENKITIFGRFLFSLTDVCYKCITKKWNPFFISWPLFDFVILWGTFLTGRHSELHWGHVLETREQTTTGVVSFEVTFMPLFLNRCLLQSWQIDWADTSPPLWEASGRPGGCCRDEDRVEGSDPSCWCWVECPWSHWRSTLHHWCLACPVDGDRYGRPCWCWVRCHPRRQGQCVWGGAWWGHLRTEWRRDESEGTVTSEFTLDVISREGVHSKNVPYCTPSQTNCAKFYHFSLNKL